MENQEKFLGIENNDSLLEILFKNKNHDYGAFELRSNYQKTINRAFYIGTSVFVLGIGAPTIYGKFTPKEKVGIVHLAPVSPPPTHETPIVELPPPTPIEQPRANTTEMNRIEILPDEIVPDAEPLPTQEEFVSSPPGDITITDGGDLTPVIDETIAVKTLVEVEPEEKIEFLPIENQAAFPGGFEKLIEYLSENIKYPRQAANAGVSGKVFLSFIIDQNGEITNIEVLKGIGFGCDEEAKRVVAKMPNWKPGSQSGRPVKSRFNLPIAFKLE